jgi:phosphoribosylaminoimidazole-succinocarboxamide synthase
MSQVQIESYYQGKVRNTVGLSNGQRVIHTTNRLSAFDVILPIEIAQKGKVLQSISSAFFMDTAHLVPNHFLGLLSESHVLVKSAKVIPIEFVMRRYLTGGLWRLYSEQGVSAVKEQYGVELPEGLLKNACLPEPILTPTTKAGVGHDLPVTPIQCHKILNEFVLENGLKESARDSWGVLTQHAHALFGYGERFAQSRNLILVDTKFEFGYADGNWMVVDEILTPDSSRYWEKNSNQGSDYKTLSKEVVREWILEHFQGKVPEAHSLISLFSSLSENQKEDFSRKIQYTYLELLERFWPETHPKSHTHYLPWPVARSLFEEWESSHRLPGRVLVVGNGGRDCTIALGLAQYLEVQHVWHGPGARQWLHPKLESLPEVTKSWQDVINLAAQQNVGLIFPGPEQPIVEGLGSLARGHSLAVLCPDVKGAQLEASKIYCKKVAWEANVQTPKAEILTWKELEPLLKSASENGATSSSLALPCVIKFDGLAAGKGVVVLQNQEDYRMAWSHFNTNLPHWHQSTAQDISEAGFLVEECINGHEMSVIALCNGTQFRLLPVARDYKRRNDQQQGPNTGGMGTVCPVPVSQSLMEQIKDCFTKVLQSLDRNGKPYFGFLFAGIMVDDKEKAWLLEFNCRLGDPETQTVLPGLTREFWTECMRVSQGKPFLFPKSNGDFFEHDSKARVFVVAAHPSYPEGSGGDTKLWRLVDLKGEAKWGLDAYFGSFSPEKSACIPGTTLIPSTLDPKGNVKGGRLFGILAEGKDALEAKQLAYQELEMWRLQALGESHGETLGELFKPHFRTDVG